MPANPRSLRVTELYRERLSVARRRLEREARTRWPSIEELDSTTWPAATAVLTAGAQREAIRATQGYLAAFLALELGRRSQPPPLDASAYVGLSRDGRPLTEALKSPLIGVRFDFKQAFTATPRSEDITPREAALLVAGGTHGNVDQERVNDLATKMRRGEWEADRGSIRITRDGFVLDGQHRLLAVLQTGISVNMLVARGLPNPLANGLNRALRMVGVDFDHAHRSALTDAMEADERIKGWQRAVKGTCGACMGDIAVEVRVNLPSIPLNIHPNCACVTQPVVIGVPQRVAMLSGVERFRQMSKAEQDEQFGLDKAEALREERISLADLVATSPLATAENFITEKPLSAAE